eukprot:CAMPEP_0176293176 /NCGR_PEP_ID=MMETSP0121_2-20121125/56470_1 /TAXON_ID=160619 /ORGANISM="Kryptoperidinium foliaceum, Strain CCMP 1326" /LENGTH=59 /DNA_ID=CAMNT_0017634123 /DNA_START=20 /DNA_END=195 /DNA_ORIENTATION=-
METASRMPSRDAGPGRASHDLGQARPHRVGEFVREAEAAICGAMVVQEAREGADDEEAA